MHFSIYDKHTQIQFLRNILQTKIQKYILLLMFHTVNAKYEKERHMKRINLISDHKTADFFPSLLEKCMLYYEKKKI